MTRQRFIILSAMIAMVAAYAAVAVWWEQHHRPKYTTVPLDWFGDIDTMDAVGKLDGRRVIVTGDVVLPPRGFLVYELHHFSTLADGSRSTQWLGPCLLQVVPAPGEIAPPDRESVTVSGLLHAQVDAGGQWRFSLAADPAGTPNQSIWSTVLLSVGPWACGMAALLPFSAAVCVALFRKWATRQRSRRPSKCCPTCGYDLRATPGRCPECGTVPQMMKAPAAFSEAD